MLLCIVYGCFKTVNQGDKGVIWLFLKISLSITIPIPIKSSSTRPLKNTILFCFAVVPTTVIGLPEIAASFYSKKGVHSTFESRITSAGYETVQ